MYKDTLGMKKSYCVVTFFYFSKNAVCVKKPRCGFGGGSPKKFYPLSPCGGLADQIRCIIPGTFRAMSFGRPKTQLAFIKKQEQPGRLTSAVS